MQTPFISTASLPLPARCALEYLNGQATKDRTTENLNKYLDHYYRHFGMACSMEIRNTCQQIAAKRYAWDTPMPVPALH